MKKKFRGTAFVIRKQYLTIIPFAIILLLFSKINYRLPYNRFIFESALLCMDNSEYLFGSYKPVFASSNIAFAETPPVIPEREIFFETIREEADSPELPDEDLSESKAVSIPSEGIEIKNQTSYPVNTSALYDTPCEFLPVEINSSSPQVLIFHTHTTESYAGSDRTDDEEKNVVSIGNVIENCLTERGINVLHCKTVHDYDYNGSYSRSYETVENILKENPTIKIILDVHRDGIIYEDGSGLRVTADINGETQAQFMLVLGTDDGGLYHPNWEQNLSFGLKLQQKMNDKYPGLARPLDLRTERFNQNLGPGMLIVECGANGNTLDEVKKGAVSFSDALFDVITNSN